MSKLNKVVDFQPDELRSQPAATIQSPPLPRLQQGDDEPSNTRYSLPHVELQIAGLSARQKMEAWREYFSGLFNVGLHNVAERDFDASASACRIGQSVLGRYSVTSTGIRRTQKNLKLEREDLLVLRVHLSGSTTGVMNGASFKMQPDRFTIFDFHQDYDAHEDNTDFISLTLPYAAIGYDPSKHARLLQFPLSAPPGRIIRSNLEWLLEAIPSSSVKDSMALSNGFTGLMRGLIVRELRDESTFRAAVRAREIAVRRYVEEHLRDPSLDAQRICGAIGVSRPVLYRIFSEEGGLQRAVTRMRLDHVLEELALSVPERGAISRISKRWCFFDQAHFTRLFRGAFGFKPSDALGSALTTECAKARNAKSDSQGAAPRFQRLADIYT